MYEFFWMRDENSLIMYSNPEVVDTFKHFSATLIIFELIKIENVDWLDFWGR